MAKTLRICPVCNVGELSRVRRNATEKFLNNITFDNYYNRKYKCYACLSEFNYSNNELKKINKQAVTDATILAEKKAKTMRLNIIAITIFILMVTSMILTNTAFNPVQTFKALISNK